jgi:hypothetical protein
VAFSFYIMPEETSQTTTDESVINTGETTTAAGTVTETQAQPDITKTPEFKAALTAAIERRIPQLKAQIAKTITGEGEGVPTVTELQQQLTEAKAKAQGYEASAAIRDYVTDPKHKLSVRAENIRAVEKLVLAEIEYDDQGSPANLKEAVEAVRTYAPALFAQTNANINQGRTGETVPNDMNAFIRQQHAGR